MRVLVRSSVAAIGAVCLFANPLCQLSAEEPAGKAAPSADVSTARSLKEQPRTDQSVREIDLLEARNLGLVSVNAEGRGDGRMTISVTNRTRHALRVILPPGLVAQGATGQMGGMGGMGGGMGGMGGGMGGMGGGMGGMMGGMGGGMGGRGGGMGGMGGMGRMSGTMPSMMGMMMLSRMIMYFCGDPESWDMRSLMIGMMGGMRGGMGGGMMGGMGGGMMGGMGGGMRSVPPTGLPSSLLNPGQTRHLPTRLVVLTPPDPREGVKLPQKGESLQLGDIADINENAQVQKVLCRLSSHVASKSISRLVMWRLTSGLSWDRIEQLSASWANRHELTLAKDFVDRLDTLPEGETGRLLFEVDGTDQASAVAALEVRTALRQKTVLGLVAEVGIPARPEGPAVTMRVRISADESRVLVQSSDGFATNWVSLGKFTVPVTLEQGKFEVGRFTDDLTEGRTQSPGAGAIEQGGQRQGKNALPVAYRQRVSPGPERVCRGRNDQQVGRDAEDLGGYQPSPAPEHDCPGERRGCQVAGAQEGGPVGRP